MRPVPLNLFPTALPSPLTGAAPCAQSCKRRISCRESRFRILINAEELLQARNDRSGRKRAKGKGFGSKPSTRFTTFAAQAQGPGDPFRVIRLITLRAIVQKAPLPLALVGLYQAHVSGAMGDLDDEWLKFQQEISAAEAQTEQPQARPLPDVHCGLLRGLDTLTVPFTACTC